MVPSPQPEPMVQSSHGLSTLCQRLAGNETNCILDLGPAIGTNVEFWSRFCEFIHIADLPSILPLAVPPQEASAPQPNWQEILRLPHGRHFNAVLAWDLLNYLDLRMIKELAAYLVAFCAPKAVLFSLIFDFREMPEENTVYRIIDDSHIRYEFRGSKTCPCPRHQTRALFAAMTGFQVANSFRLRNGVIEYLFVREMDPV